MTDKSNKTDPLVGTQIGDYRVKSLVGIGGMARVYEAYDEKLDRRVAIKLMTAQHEGDDETAQRFWREAKTLANLDHPHIVTMYHVGEINHAFYISMRFIEGKTLLTALKKLHQQKKFMEPDQVVAILGEIAGALDYAHSKGVIHRDIKPSNIMLTGDGHAILTDFGLMMSSESDSTLGTAFGTPRYIAPEQAISSHRAVPQSDIYSLGVVLYEIVTGQAPFDNDSPMSLALSHITNAPPAPRLIRADVPPEVERVILKALEKRPEDRYQTATAMIDALRRAYQLPVTDSPPVRIAMPLDPPTFAATPDPTALLSPAALREAINAQGDQVVADAPVPRRISFVRAVPYVLIAVLVILLTVFAGSQLIALISPPPVSPLSSAANNTTPAPPPVRLIYSKAWFAIYNATGAPVSLHGITFVHGDGSDGRPPFDPSKYLGDSAISSLGSGQCVHIRLQSGDDRALPLICGPQNRPGLITDPGARFWLATSDKDTIFTVKRDQKVLQTCLLALNTCEFRVS